MISDRDLLAYDPFADDKDGADTRCHRHRVVWTRKVHQCLFTPATAHEMPKGTRAVVYEFIAGGTWHRGYICAEHIESFYEHADGNYADGVA